MKTDKKENKLLEGNIEIPISYIDDENGLDYDYDYMRILFERKLELMFHLKK